MPSGEHPNSKANLSKGKRFSEENAREMAEKSHEARRANGMLSADLKGQLDEETIERLNAKLIAMAEKGNLKAYELIRDGIGEKPNEKVDLSIEDESAREIDEYFAAKDNRANRK